MIEIKTARYTNKTLLSTDLTPVGITLGYPRFKLPYELKSHSRLLAPSRDLLHSSLSEEEFKVRLFEQLDRTEGRAFDFLLSVQKLHDSRGLVLLCFEDIRKPGEWCHRRHVAEWLELRHGIVVDELEESEPPSGGGGKRIVRPKPRVDVELQTRLNLLPF